MGGLYHVISFFSFANQIIRDKKFSATKHYRVLHVEIFFPALVVLSRSLSSFFLPFSMLYFAATWPPPDGRHNVGNVNIYTSGLQFRAILHHFWHARRPHKFNELIFYGSIRDESGTQWKKEEKKRTGILYVLEEMNPSVGTVCTAYSRIVSGICTARHIFFIHLETHKLIFYKSFYKNKL